MFRKIVAWLVAPLTRSIITAMKNDVAFLSDVSGALSDHMCRSTIVEMVVDNLNVSAMDIANSLDMHDVAAHIDIDSLEEEIANRVDVDASEVAQEINFSDLAAHIDASEIEVDQGYIAEKVAESFNASDIAEHVDTYSIAQEVCIRSIADELEKSDIADYIETSELAREIDMGDLADALTWREEDYERLAKALLKQFSQAIHSDTATT